MLCAGELSPRPSPTPSAPPEVRLAFFGDSGTGDALQIADPNFGYRDHRRYYSIVSDTGHTPLVEVFVLDSNTLAVSDTKLWPSGDDRAQTAWLDAALAASRARWKMVAMHHPPHSPLAARHVFGLRDGEWMFGGRAREARLDDQIGPTLRKHGVDVVFAGHNHFYARMAPQGGIRYFVAGGGDKPPQSFEPAPGYVAAGGAFNHFVYVRATAEAFEYYTIDDQGRSRDGGWFGKGRPDRPPLRARHASPGAGR